MPISVPINLDVSAMANVLDQFLANGHGVQIGMGECIKAAQAMVAAGVGSSSLVTFSFNIQVGTA